MTFEELIVRRSVPDLEEAARQLLGHLNREVGQLGRFDGAAHCYALPLAQIVAEIARRKRNTANKDDANKSEVRDA